MKFMLRSKILGAIAIVGFSASLACAQAPAAPAIEPEYRQSFADFMALKAKAKPAQLPNLAGVWRRATGPGGLGAFGNEAGINTAAPNAPGSPPNAATRARLTPKYDAAYKKKLAQVAKGIEWDRLSYCLPAGMPRWMTEPWMREFIVTPEVTWMIHEQISEVRRVYTDGKTHTAPGEVGPLWEGESIGFWDGDTLVIHTTHLKAGEYQRGQPDYSFKTSTLEKFRKIDANTIEDQITVYDPESLLEPLHATFTYRKVPDPSTRINFSSCEEGNNAARTPEGGSTFILPGEPGYHDPQTFGIPEVALDSLPQ